jgi:hypothetical protein
MLARYKISNLSLFKSVVFGADCFLEHWPQLETTGITLKKCSDHYYVADENGKLVHDTAFFTIAELERCLVKC